jgi:hypothetical protein
MMQRGAHMHKQRSDRPARECRLSEAWHAEQLGLSTRTLADARRAGALAYYRIGTRILYGEAHIAEWLARHEQQRVDDPAREPLYELWLEYDPNPPAPSVFTALRHELESLAADAIRQAGECGHLHRYRDPRSLFDRALQAAEDRRREARRQ